MKLKKAASVYVIYNEKLNITKIGISDDVQKRKESLQNSCGVPLILYHYTNPILNYFDIEKKAHQRFKSHRLLGEWFNVEPDEAKKYIISIEHIFEPDYIYNEYIKTGSIKTLAAKYKVSRTAIIKRLNKHGEIKAPTQKKESKAIFIDSISDYKRISPQKYQHKKTGKIENIKYINGTFQIIKD